MNNRILLIIAAVIVVLGIGVGLYLFFFSGKPALTVNPGGSFATSTDRTDTGTDQGGVTQGAGTVLAPRLLKITDHPVAKGVAVLYIPASIVSTSATSSDSATQESLPADVEVRYVERESGNIYAFRVHDRTSVRTSNQTLPGVQEVAWTSDGIRAFLRFIGKNANGTEVVDTYAMKNDGSSGYFLEEGLDSVTVQATSTVFSLLPGSSGSLGALSAPDGTNGRTIFSSTLSALKVAFAGKDLIATTKASSGLDGYAFLVSRANGSFTRILGPLPGLATLPSPDGTQVLYSYVDRGKLYTQVLNLSSKTAIALPLATLAEKCVWTPDSSAVYCGVPTALSRAIPDDWYQGAYSFSDRIWKIDLSTRLATLMVDPNQVASVQIDAVALAVDPKSDVLVFTNKKDGSLWSYDLP